MIRGSWSVSLASYETKKHEIKRVIYQKISSLTLWHTGYFYLEEVFNPFRVVAVALSTDSLHFFDLARFTGSLDVLKMNIRLLAEIHDGPKEVKQALDRDSRGETRQRSAQSMMTMHMTSSLHKKRQICSFNTFSCCNSIWPKSANKPPLMCDTYPHNSWRIQRAPLMPESPVAHDT